MGDVEGPDEAVGVPAAGPPSWPQARTIRVSRADARRTSSERTEAAASAAAGGRASFG
jgi:hypothetical protein